MRKVALLCVVICSIAGAGQASADGPASLLIQELVGGHGHMRLPLRPGAAADGSGGAPAARTKVVRWGPFQIPAATSTGPGMIAYPGFKLEMPCTSCFITSMAIDLVQEDGQPLNYGTTPSGRGSWIVINAARAAVPCGTVGEAVFAAPNERTDLVLPPGYGYYNPWFSQWFAGLPALQNFSSQIITAFIEFSVSYVPSTAKLKPVTFIGLDQTDCTARPPFYTIPQGHSDVHKEWTVDRGGEIVAIVGHMHDFGISVAVENVTTGQHVCTSVAGYAKGSAWAPVGPGSGVDDLHPASHYAMDPGNPDYAGHIQHMDVCLPKLPVKKGDVLRLHTQYNSPQPLTDVMGTMGIYMHVTDPPPCTLAMDLLDYRDGTLSLLFNVGRSKAEAPGLAAWNLWLVTASGMARLRSSLLPGVDPPVPILRSISGLSGLGRVGVLSTISTTEGTICSEWKTVDTGPATAGSATSLAQVAERELALDEATFAQRMALRFGFAASKDVKGASTTAGACHLGEEAAPPRGVEGPGAGHQVTGLSTPVLNPANGHYYEAVAAPGGIDWSHARQEVAQLSFNAWGGHLAAVTSKAENDFLMSTFPQIAGTDGYWLGGYRPASGGEASRGWIWLTGEALVYTNWQAGGLAGEGGPQAIHLSTSAGEWDGRLVVSQAGGYVVEYEPACALTVGLDRDAGTLKVNVTATAGEPAKWNLWLVVDRQAIPIVSKLELPGSGEASASVPLPRSGVVGLLTTVTTSGGTVCSDWRTVDAGAPATDAASPIETIRQASSGAGR